MSGGSLNNPSPFGAVDHTIKLALRREDAARALSVSEESFDRYVRPTLPVARVGTLRLYAVADLERWLRDRAVSPVDELDRRAA